MAPKRPHTRSDTSQQKAPILSDPEKLVSKKGQKTKIFSTPDATLLAHVVVLISYHPRIFPENSFSQKKNPYPHPFISKNQH